MVVDSITLDPAEDILLASVLAIKTYIDDQDTSTSASDVTAAAVIANDVLVRGDGGSRGVQGSTALLADSGVLTIQGNILGGGSLFLEQKAAADDDVTNKGQFWVKNTSPTESWVTDDVGTDWASVLAKSGVVADNSLVRGDGGVYGIQDSGVLIDNSDNVSAINDLDVGGDQTVAGSVALGTAVAPDVMLHLVATDGTAIIRMERNDTTIGTNDVYGEIQWEGQDASTDAAGVRATIKAVATGSLGGTEIQFLTTQNTSTTLVEGLTVTSAGDVDVIAGLDVGGDLTVDGDVLVGGATTSHTLSSNGTTFTMAGTSTTQSIVETGVDDTVRGIFRAYGHATGQVLGGQLQLRTAADHDTTISQYLFRVSSDDLLIGPSNDIDALKYDGGAGTWNFTGTNGVVVTNTMQAGTVTADNGVAAFGPAAVASIKVVNGIVTAIS